MFEKLLFLFELPFEDALRQRAKCKSLKKEKEADNDQLSVKNSERKVVIDHISDKNLTDDREHNKTDCNV